MNFLYNNFLILILCLLGLLLTATYFLIISLKETKTAPQKLTTVYKISDTKDEASLELKKIDIENHEENLNSDKSTQIQPAIETEITEQILNENTLQKDKKDFLSNYCQEKSRNNKIEKPLFIIGIIGVCLLALGLIYYVMSFIADFIKIKGH